MSSKTHGEIALMTDHGFSLEQAISAITQRSDRECYLAYESMDRNCHGFTMDMINDAVLEHLDTAKVFEHLDLLGLMRRQRLTDRHMELVALCVERAVRRARK